MFIEYVDWKSMQTLYVTKGTCTGWRKDGVITVTVSLDNAAEKQLMSRKYCRNNKIYC